MRVNLSSRATRIVVAVVTIAAAALFFRSAVLQILVEPIGWLLWAGWRLVASIPQSICWSLVVMISAVLLIRIIPARLKGAGQTTTPKSEWGSASRLDHWQGLAGRAAQDRDGRTALQSALTTLEVAVEDSTRQSPPKREADTATGWGDNLLSRLLPGRQRTADMRAMEARLEWMESALEIKHERSIK